MVFKNYYRIALDFIAKLIITAAGVAAFMTMGVFLT